MTSRRDAIAACAAMLGASWARGQAAATAFPSRPLRIVVPYAPGGITDSAARWVGQKLQERFAQTVTVDNKPGASGAIGAESAALAPADGHTLMCSITSMLQAPILDPNLRFDLERDFAAVAQLGVSALILVAPASLEAPDLARLKARLTAAPDSHSFGSIGAGSSLHLYGDELARRWNVRPTHVPFKGAAPLVVELLAGRVDYAFIDFMTVRAHVESGRLRALAVTGTRRSPLFPAVPTLEESGLAGFDVTSWVAMFAPRATPAPIVAQLSAELIRIMNGAELVSRFAEAGMESKPTTSDEFARRLATDRQAWSRLIAASRASASR